MPRQAPKSTRSVQPVSSHRNKANHWDVLFFVIVILVVLLLLMKWGLNTHLAVITLVSMVTYRCSSNSAYRGIAVKVAPALLKYFR
jgi:uncharacterized integral membrane protein